MVATIAIGVSVLSPLKKKIVLVDGSFLYMQKLATWFVHIIFEKL